MNKLILSSLDQEVLIHSIENLPVPLLIVKNEDGVLKTQYLNREFRNVIGYAIEEIPDMKAWYKLVFPQAIYRVAIKSERLKAVENAISAGENITSNIARIRLKSGVYNWFDIKTTIDREYQFIVFSNINDVNEDNLRLHTELIVKNNVLSILSHDLRKPFANIKALSDLLQSEIHNSNTENIEEYVNLIKKTSASALVMLEELLVSARMESQESVVLLQKVNLRQMIEDIIEKFKLDIAYKIQEIEQKINTQKSFILDKLKTEQILTNLLSNAIKYSEQGKKITIGADYIKENIILWVQDEGLGFDEKDRKKMFGKFQTLSAQPTGGEKSVGLGLYICKTFAEQQNGRIVAESQGKGYGSKFIVEIPAREADD
jgi:signal transduction histidine kinase